MSRITLDIGHRGMQHLCIKWIERGGESKEFPLWIDTGPNPNNATELQIGCVITDTHGDECKGPVLITQDRDRSINSSGLIWQIHKEQIDKLKAENAELKQKLQASDEERAAGEQRAESPKIYQNDLNNAFRYLQVEYNRLLQILTIVEDQIATLFAENENLKKDVKRVNKSRDAFCDVYDRLLTENIAMKAKAQTP